LRRAIRFFFSSGFIAAALFLGAVLACIMHTVAWTENRATHEVCRLIRENYFRSAEPKVQTFLNNCDEETTSMSFSRAEAIDNINRKLSAIRSSHLNVFSPSENRWLWEHEGSDTGIRTRLIDGELIVIRILERSPAALAGIQPGDAIVAINGEAPSSVQDAQSTAGHYKIARGGAPGTQVLEADLELADLVDHMGPTLVPLNKDVAVLNIPSFLPQYFEQRSFRELVSRLNNFKGIVIDLRDNAGGSFPAMLRALSPFRCGNARIGKLWRAPRTGVTPEIEIKDELSAESQLNQLAEADALVLRTFSGYGCFKGEAVVLVDDGTSSVSEIFANALKKQPSAQVWGTPTAGQVVMARWFSVGSLGGGNFAISIPIAGYLAADGSQIESEGVIPDKELHYDLRKALRGEDSWIEEARSHVSK
jgi:C-terminal processing protease CtpA/Prc